MQNETEGLSVVKKGDGTPGKCADTTWMLCKIPIDKYTIKNEDMGRLMFRDLISCKD